MTLLDHEVSLAVEPFGAPTRWSLRPTAHGRHARRRRAADFVVAAADRLDPGLPLRLRQGTLAYPNDSATLLVLVPTLDQADSSRASVASALAGPASPAGHGPHRRADPAPFEARDEAAEYPCGIDLILVDPTAGSSRCHARPRSGSSTRPRRR